MLAPVTLFTYLIILRKFVIRFPMEGLSGNCISPCAAGQLGICKVCYSKSGNKGNSSKGKKLRWIWIKDWEFLLNKRRSWVKYPFKLRMKNRMKLESIFQFPKLCKKGYKNKSKKWYKMRSKKNGIKITMKDRWFRCLGHPLRVKTSFWARRSLKTCP